MKRRVCIFCEKWESGGIESFITGVLTHMDLTELQIDIVVSELAPSIFVEPLEKMGVTFFELSGNQKRVLKNRKLLRRHLESGNYDIVHLNVFQGLSLQYLKIAKECHVERRIAHSHNTALRRSGTRLLKLGLHYAAKLLYARYATDYLACSKAAAEFMFPPHTVYRFIANGVDMERFAYCAEQRHAMRKRLGVSEDCLLVGSVGRLCYQKNQMFLLDVAAELFKKRKDAKLLLIGDGEARRELECHAQKLGITNKVFFWGTTKEPEHMYAAMDLLAFPSLFEGLGIVVIEAQANGLPVLCSEHIPPEASVTDLAITVPLGDGAASWADAICRYQGHKELSEKETLKCMRFDVHAVAGEMQAIYET